jgi:primosomal protein N'
MRLLSIVPIARGIRKETLTYFSTKDIEAGALVTMPLRKKEIPGIVLESIDAMQNKSAIKDMDFTIRKITDFDNKVSIPDFIMRASAKIADISATSIGSVVASIIPKICLEHPSVFFTRETTLNTEQNIVATNSFDIVAIQSANEERMDTYRSIIRESFAKKKSIAIICPTEQKSIELYKDLQKGITDHTIILSKTTSKKQLEEFKSRISNSTHPLLIVGTYYLLSLLDYKTGTIILEEESSTNYKSRKRPYLDIRYVVKEIAKSMNAKLIFGDKLLSVQTLAEVKEGTINEYARIDKRNNYKIQTLLIDTKPSTNTDPREKKKFEILSTDLKEMISYSAKYNKKIVIYATRRGVASQTVCNDCGTTVVCENCDSPVVLHTIKEKRTYICHHCGVSKEATENCKTCQGWNLVPLGIGIEKIEEEIKKITENVIRIDSDNTKSQKDLREKVESFYSSGCVLITTDLAVPYLKDTSLDYAAIPTLDSIFSLPDFRTSEKVMHTILDLKSKATECILIQTRNSKHKVIDQALAGDLEGFTNDEIKARKDFGYAPYVNVIKLSIQGKKDQVKTEAQRIVSELKQYNPVVFPAFIKADKGNTSLNIILKLTKAEWPNKELLDTLLSFPPNIKIDTTPTSLL